MSPPVPRKKLNRAGMFVWVCLVTWDGRVRKNEYVANETWLSKRQSNKLQRFPETESFSTLFYGF